MYTFSVILILLLNSNDLLAHSRKLSTAINPGCKEEACLTKNDSTPLLVHIRAQGENDTLHHVWDFTGSPSLLLVQTGPDAELNITWDKYIRGNGTKSISFSEEPGYVFAVVFDKLFEFNDTNDTGVFDPLNANPHYVRTIHTSSFHWKLTMPMTNDSTTALLSVEGVHRHRAPHHHHGNTTAPDGAVGAPENQNQTGSIRITMGAYGGAEHDGGLPHLLHSANASQMDVTLDHLPTVFQSPRFGISLIIATSDSPNATMATDLKRSVDDEYSPGVFSMVEVTSPGVTKNPLVGGGGEGEGGYLQWRPIVYTSHTRDDTNSTDSLQYGIDHVSPSDISSKLNSTLPFKVFGETLKTEYLLQTTNVTFGSTSDGFYKRTKFATWTFVAGIGSPAREAISNVVLLILAIGLGLPLVLIILGLLCVVVRRVMRNKDDLFLSQ